MKKYVVVCVETGERTECGSLREAEVRCACRNSFTRLHWRVEEPASGQ